jgi:hypothetical protein
MAVSYVHPWGRAEGRKRPYKAKLSLSLFLAAEIVRYQPEVIALSPRAQQTIFSHKSAYPTIPRNVILQTRRKTDEYSTAERRPSDD